MTKNKTTIPNGWILDRLGKQVRLEYGSGLPERNREKGEYPVFGSSGIVAEHSTAKVKGPGIVIGRKGTIGSVMWSKKDFWPIDTTYYVEVDDLIDQVWLYYQLQHLELNKLNTGSGVPGLNREEVYKVLCLFPPKNEQEKIAEVLSAVDEDIEKTDAVIAQTEKLKKGLMQELFTKGIGHTKFKKTKLGMIPEAWGIHKLHEVLESVIDNRGKTPPTNNDGHPLIEVNAIKEGKKEPDYLEIKKYVSEDTYTKWFRSGHPAKGDVLIPTVGTIGVAALMTQDKGCIAQNIVALRPSALVDPEYLYYYISSGEFISKLKKVVMNAVQPSLKVPHMLELLIRIPRHEEQEKIANILSVIDEKIVTSKKNKEKLLQLKKGLMSDLLSGSVRVKI